MTGLLNQAEIDAAVASLHDGWSGDGAGLRRSIDFSDFLTAVEFIVRIAPRCEALDHHPDLLLSWRRVSLELVSHSAGGVTSKDVELARALDEVADSLPLAT